MTAATVAALLGAGAPSVSARCPAVEMKCLTHVHAGEPASFEVNVTPEPASSMAFAWEVSAGTIMEGQGMSRITVDTTGLGEQPVKATVSVRGLAPERHTLMDAGFREDLTVVLWVVPPDKPPAPAPTVAPAEVEFVKSPRPARRARRRP